MRRLSLWGPVVLWAAVIFALSSVPHLGTDLGTWDTVLRKCAHATEYAILALLLYRALGRELPAFLIGFAYAITDELHQAFVSGRHASPFDVSMDAAGLALGPLLLHATRLTVQSQRGSREGIRRPPSGRGARAARRPARGAEAAEPAPRPHRGL